MCDDGGERGEAASKRQLPSALGEGGGGLIKADAASASINRHKLYVAPNKNDTSKISTAAISLVTFLFSRRIPKIQSLPKSIYIALCKHVFLRNLNIN